MASPIMMTKIVTLIVAGCLWVSPVLLLASYVFITDFAYCTVFHSYNLSSCALNLKVQ